MTSKEFKIPQIYLPYLINGDETGLTEAQLATVQKWEKDNTIFETIPDSDVPYLDQHNDVKNEGWSWVLDCTCLIS